MSIRIGIYDFFAYTIPGGLVLLIITGVLDTLGIQGLWEQLKGLNTLQILIFLVACYLTGFASNPVFTKWSTWFEPRHFEEDVLARFKARNPAIPIEINPADWPVWFASIRRENLEMAVEIDRNMAISKMIRSLSLFLLLGGILATINVIIGRLPVWNLIAVLLSGGFSYLSIKEAIRFKQRFYLMIFETVVSRKEPFTAVPKSEKDNKSGKSTSH